MRHYDIRINETTYALEVEEIAHDAFTVHLDDGQLIDVRLTGHHDLSQALISPQIEAGRSSPAPAPVREQPAPTRPSIVPVRRSAPGSSNAMTAPMPGVVLSVEVAPGAQVVRGQTLLVLEAMKMKNDIKSDHDAHVKHVHVASGDQVKHGDLLIEFEAHDGR